MIWVVVKSTEGLYLYALLSAILNQIKLNQIKLNQIMLVCLFDIDSRLTILELF